MDGLTRLILAIVGGGLLVYGFTKRGATKKANPFAEGVIERMMEVPDEGARTDGNLALFIGAAFVLAALFAG